MAAFAILNVAPGYDACGNKIKGYPYDDDSIIAVEDSTELLADTIVVE